MKLSVGIGLTNNCNLNCPHCYRPMNGIHNLTLDDVRLICDRLPVGSIGMGTGENVLNPEFGSIVRFLQERGIKMTLASNGYGINTMTDELLMAFHDVEVSVDFDNQADQEAFRGEGNWKAAHAAVDRCHQLDMRITTLACMMSVNYNQMDGLVDLARELGTNLRVNVYQAMHTDQYKLSYAQFWEGYRRLFANASVINCSEPVVKAVMGLEGVLSPCGRQSVRFTPKGEIVPCVYWPESDLKIEQLDELGAEGILESTHFKISREVPPVAENCPCQGGCASRRALNGEMDAHDDYCPWIRGESPALDYQLAAPQDVLRSSHVCTTVVQP